MHHVGSHFLDRSIYLKETFYIGEHRDIARERGKHTRFNPCSGKILCKLAAGTVRDNWFEFVFRKIRREVKHILLCPSRGGFCDEIEDPRTHVRPARSRFYAQHFLAHRSVAGLSTSSLAARSSIRRLFHRFFRAIILPPMPLHTKWHDFMIRGTYLFTHIGYQIRRAHSAPCRRRCHFVCGV